MTKPESTQVNRVQPHEIHRIAEEPSVTTWVNEVCRHVEQNRTPETNRVIISDVDDALFDTSGRWFERMYAVCQANFSKLVSTQLNLPFLSNFRHDGPRKTFQPYFDALGKPYDQVRDEILQQEDFYLGIPTLVNTKALKSATPRNVLWGGYLSGRADSIQLRSNTKSELDRNGFPNAPILLQPQSVPYEQGTDYKVAALAQLRTKLDELGYDGLKIVVVDDYHGNVDAITQNLGDNVTAVQCPNLNQRYHGSRWDEILVDLATQSDTYDFYSLPHPSISRPVQDSSREIAADVSGTSPTGSGRVIETVLRSALYPIKSIKMIEEMDGKFQRFWFQLSSEIREKYKGHSASALLATYYFARDIFGPLRVMHTLSVLNEAGPEDTVHFLARDGLPEYIVASQLKRAGMVVPQINYLPISTRLMRWMDNPDKRPVLDAYLQQFNISGPGKHMLVDIGFTGETPDRLSKLYPDTDFIPRFLLSMATPEVVQSRPVMTKASGFAFDVNDVTADQMFKTVVVTNVEQVRMMEDTFGGIRRSSTDIVQSRNGKLITNSNVYTPSFERMLRHVAMMGIGDAAQIYCHALTNGMDSDRLLHYKPKFVSNYKQFLMYLLDPEFDTTVRNAMFVSHEPTNPS